MKIALSLKSQRRIVKKVFDCSDFIFLLLRRKQQTGSDTAVYQDSGYGGGSSIVEGGIST